MIKDREIGHFRFKARFENGRGLVTVSVVEKGEDLRTLGFYVNITEQRQGEASMHGA